jgi:hypothetical protein
VAIGVLSHPYIDGILAAATHYDQPTATASKHTTLFSGRGVVQLDYNPAVPFNVTVSYCRGRPIRCESSNVTVRADYHPNWAPRFMYCQDLVPHGVFCTLVDPSAIQTTSPPGIHCRPPSGTGATLECDIFPDGPWPK